MGFDVIFEIMDDEYMDLVRVVMFCYFRNEVFCVECEDIDFGFDVLDFDFFGFFGFEFLDFDWWLQYLR